MSDHEPTTRDDRDGDGSVGGGGGNSEALDASKVPEEFPEDRPVASRDYGTTESEQAHREPLDRRLRREVPDVDELDADYDDEDSDDEGSPSLLSNRDDHGDDLVKDLSAERSRRPRDHDDSGQPDAPASAEEEAVHVIDQDGPLEEG